MNRSGRRISATMAALVFLGLSLGAPPLASLSECVIQSADAQPAKRINRRTNRRVRRRAVGATLAALPPGYRTVVVAGATYYYVNGVYYQAVEQDGATVYIVVEDPE